MLMPKRTKFRRVQRGRMKGKASRGTTLSYGSYGLMAVVAFSMLILVYAYLKIITVIYFEPRNISFDRVDKGVYTYIAVNLLLIAVTVINPKYLMHDVEMMLAAIL